MTSNSPAIPEEFQDPQFIHTLLLDSEWKENFREASAPLSFEDYSSDLEQNPLQKAFRDQILRFDTLGPLNDMLIELHKAIRNLIPTRTDLHDRLKDEKGIEDLKVLKDKFIIASQALAMLESERQAESTLAWTQLAHQQRDSLKEFLTNASMYLMYKTQLCQQEKRFFYLETLWAPQLRQHGPEILRRLFRERHPNPEATHSWIEEITRKQPSIDDKVQFLHEAIIRTILFRSSEAGSLQMPEIFEFDQELLGQIRGESRIVIAATALTQHINHILGQSLASSQQQSLLDRLSNNLVPNYEELVLQTVLRVAREVKSDIATDQVKDLDVRTRSILLGQDAVVSLYQKRLQAFLRETGTSTVEQADRVFRERGFIGDQLSRLSVKLYRSVALVWELYGEWLLKDLTLARGSVTTESANELEIARR